MKKEQSGSRSGKDEGDTPAVKPVLRRSFGARLRNYFLTGIIVTAPIGITIYLAWAFVDYVDRTVTPLIPPEYNPETYLKFSVPGLGMIVAVVVLTLIGFLTANFLGRSLIRIGERIVERMPVIRSIYGALKQIIETILAQSSTAFRQVVLVEYPRRGMWTLAFVSAEVRGEVAGRLNEKMISIYVPTTPNPTSGYLVFVPEADVKYLDMSVEEGMKLVISVGVIAGDEDDANVKELKARAREDAAE